MSRYFDRFRKDLTMATRTDKPTKAEALLVNLAKSIGSAKADAALVAGDVTSKIEREGKKFARLAKKLAGILDRETEPRSAARSRPSHAAKRNSAGSTTRSAKPSTTPRRKSSRTRVK